MPNFIDNDTSLPSTKVDAGPLVGPANQSLDAADINSMIQASLDIRTVLYRQVSIMSYGGDPTDTADNYGAFVAACAALSSGGILHLPVGTYKLGTNFSVPANITLAFDSSTIAVANGVTLTINGTVDANPVQIFSFNSAPSAQPVTFGTTPQSLNAKWFGAKGDGATDDTNALKWALIALNGLATALNALPSPAVGAANIQYLELPAGRYNVTGTLELNCYSGLRGIGRAVLQTASTSIPILRIGAAWNEIENISFEGGLNSIALFGVSTYYGGYYGVTSFGNAPCNISRCHFAHPVGPAIWQDCSPVTELTSGSNGQTFPFSATTLHIVSNAGFGSSGTVTIFDSAGAPHAVTFTGSSSTTLTGAACADTTAATLATNGFVGGSQFRTFQASVRVTDFYFVGACLFWGFGDCVAFSGGQITWDFSSAPTSTDGYPLGVWNSADDLKLSDIYAFGTNSQPARSAIIVGQSLIDVSRCVFAQNDAIVFCRSKSSGSNAYQGAAAVPVPLTQQETLSLIVDDSDLTCSFGVFWLEIYDNLPQQILLKNTHSVGTAEFFGTLGIWLDEGVALPQNIDLGRLTWQTDRPRGLVDDSLGTELAIFQGFDPGAGAAPTFADTTDVTSAFNLYTRPKPENSASASVYQENLFKGLSTDNTSFLGVIGGSNAGADTTTGISLTGYNGGTSWGATLADNQIDLDGQSCLPGVYTLSIYIKVNYPCEIEAQIGPTGANTVSAIIRLEAASTFQRIEVPFWFPGNGATLAAVFGAQIPAAIAAWSSTTYTAGQRVVSGGKVYLVITGGSSTSAPTGTGSGINNGGSAVFNYVSSGAVFTPYTNVGLWMVNAGAKAAPYTFSQNADSAAALGWVPRNYYGTAAPTAGVYFKGDVCWNTSPTPSGVALWICTSAGSPGTWKSVSLSA
jgi:hypothetical protein